MGNGKKKKKMPGARPASAQRANTPPQAAFKTKTNKRTKKKANCRFSIHCFQTTVLFVVGQLMAPTSKIKKGNTSVFRPGFTPKAISSALCRQTKGECIRTWHRGNKVHEHCSIQQQYGRHQCDRPPLRKQDPTRRGHNDTLRLDTSMTLSYDTSFLFWGGGGAQTKMSWRSLTSQYSRCPLGIKVQSCPVLR